MHRHKYQTGLIENQNKLKPYLFDNTAASVLTSCNSCGQLLKGLHTGSNQSRKKLLAGPFCTTGIIYISHEMVQLRAFLGLI